MSLTLKVTGYEEVRPCAVCGLSVLVVPPGPVLCVDGTRDPVCSACGDQHAPALSRLLALAAIADAFALAVADQDCGERPEALLPELENAAVAFAEMLRARGGAPTADKRRPPTSSSQRPGPRVSSVAH